jgi:hypothetical protein
VGNDKIIQQYAADSLQKSIKGRKRLNFFFPVLPPLAKVPFINSIPCDIQPYSARHVTIS